MAALTLLALGPATQGHAADHLIAPAAEAAEAAKADGSVARPWPSIAAALDSGRVAGGDTLRLAAGAHGPLVLRARRFDPPVVVESAPGARAHLDWIQFRDVEGLVLRDLDVWPRADAPPPRRALVVLTKGTRNVSLVRLDIRSTADAPAYADWDAETWRAHGIKGVQIDGPDNALIDSRVTAVGTGVGVNGARVRIAGNEIRGFSRDGMRVFGRDMVISGNTIRDCVKINNHHDDGIQSWARKGRAPDEVVGITVEANRIIEWTGAREHPLRCVLQGIGLFDGPYRDWTIRNNLVLVRAAHGIALGGMENGVVANNTVVNIDGEVGKKPWIRLGKRSQDNGNTVVNNVANALMLGQGAEAAMMQRHNLKIVSFERSFENLAAGDYTPRPGGPLHDAGDPDAAPPNDIDGTARPQGAKPDMGAYERR